MIAATLDRSAAADVEKKSARPLRVLILGGTGHIGPHFVQAALARGHQVAVFNRGKSDAHLPSSVERLVGDRNSNLTAIQNRDWDAVLDLATYGPGWVRSLGNALRGRVRHYTFISTINAYDHSVSHPQGIDERSTLVEYKDAADPYSLTTWEKGYGELKVLCEREAERQFPGKTLILRPSYIVGPGDPVGALTYWSARLEKGGEILAAGDANAPIHVIDVRDMTRWAIELVERTEAGTFNAVGPAAPTNWGQLLKELGARATTPIKTTWIPMAWLEARKLGQFSNLLFWPSGVSCGGTPVLIKNDKARAEGLALRPVSNSAADALAWSREQPAERQAQLLLGVEGKASLETSMAREAELLAAWHEEKA